MFSRAQSNGAPSLATSDRRKLGARRACVDSVEGRARPQEARTPLGWRGLARAAMKSVDVCGRQRRNRKGSAGNRLPHTMRRGLPHSSESGRRQGCKGVGDCAPQGEKARKQGGKREPPPAIEERPKDTLKHIPAGRVLPTSNVGKISM